MADRLRGEESVRSRTLGALSALALLAMLVLTVSASGASSADGATGTYIVQMIQAPTATYAGGVAGIPATKPAEGKKFDRKAAAVSQYVGHLTERARRGARRGGR